MRYFLFILLSLSSLTNVLAQDGNNIPVGTWRIHAPYLNALHVTYDAAHQKVYSCSQEGLLYVDSDGSTHGLTVLDGLASMEFSTIGYASASGKILIAYRDGNIDILDGNSLTNVNDIFRSTTLVGSKAINHITVENNTAYLSADFGVCVLNLTTLEIVETWKNLSAGSVENPVYGSTLSSDKDSIFLATENGVLGGKIAPGINLMDFSNWKSYGTAQGLPSGSSIGVAAYNGTVYAGFDMNGIYALSGTQWILANTPITSTMPVVSLRNTTSGVLVSANDFVIRITDPLTYTYAVNPIWGARCADCDIDANNTYWVADAITGLSSNNGSSRQSYTVNGPTHSNHFHLHYKNNNMVSVAGAYDKTLYQATYNNMGFYEFVQNAEWKNYSYFYNGQDSRDLIDAEYSPDGKLYLASYTQGLYIRATDGTYSLLNHTNSNLIESFPGNGETRVSGLGMDSHSNLWISNVSTPYSTTLHRMTPTGVWTSYNLVKAEGAVPSEITVDESDNKWIILTNGNGIMVFNETSGIRERYLTNVAGSGGLPSKAVYTLAIDNDGHLWAGTDKGVAVLYNASTYLSAPHDFTQPIYAGFPLLFDRVIYDIVIDGGNRKWIGTDNGIWLMNDDCSRIITTFNTDNSPLISNYILDMELNTLTGELFIATDKGLMSFRSDATEPSKDYSGIKVFPNPVKPGFTGYLTVSGLVENSTVKITDITGQLVFQDKSNGGTISWDLNDYSGKKIRTGVYLIFLSDEEGNQTRISQFAVVE